MELVFNNFLNGDVYKLKISDIDTYFEKNQYDFSSSGINTFLKALKIPVSYFQKQPQETKIQLLTNQKDLMSHDKELFVLKKGDSLEFCCLGDEEILKELKIKTPINKDWVYLYENLSSGYIRFFIPDGKLKTDEYNIGLFVDYPILFSKPMLINFGFYKLNEEDSELNYELVIPDNTIKLKNEALPETSHNTYFIDLLNEILTYKLDSIITFLDGFNTDTETCLSLLNEFQKEKKLPKSVCYNFKKYVNKNSIPLNNYLEFSENLFIFINYIKTYSGRNKFKTNILDCMLRKYSKIPSFILDYFNEGY